MPTELKAPDNDDVQATPIEPGTLDKLEEALGKPDTKLEDLGEDSLALIRGMVTQLRAREDIASQVTEDSDGEETQELSPERAATLAALEYNYKKLETFANGVTWADTEKALRASPTDLDKLAKLLTLRPNSDLTVTGRENGEIMFEEIAPDCPGVKNITYDKDAQTLAESRGEKCNENAIDIAASFGAKPIARNRYKALIGKVKGLDESTWAWVLTDEATRKTGGAHFGGNGDVGRDYANFHHELRGVRLALGVKEV